MVFLVLNKHGCVDQQPVNVTKRDVQNSRMEEMIQPQPAARPGPSQRCCAPAQEHCTSPPQPCVWVFYRGSAFTPAAATRTAAQTVKVERAGGPDTTAHTHTPSIAFHSCNRAASELVLMVTPPPFLLSITFHSLRWWKPSSILHIRPPPPLHLPLHPPRAPTGWPGGSSQPWPPWREVHWAQEEALGGPLGAPASRLHIMC